MTSIIQRIQLLRAFTADNYYGSRYHGSQRGSALIITLLILLALSAVGMTAMRSVTGGIWMSGLYRTDTQAALYSDAAINYASQLTGHNASTYLNMLRHRSEAIVGNMNELRRGSYMIFISPSGYTGDIDDDPTTFIELGYDGTTTGLFSTTSNPSLEGNSALPGSYAYIIRDPMQGPLVPGYSKEYCFKKLTIGSRSILGDPTATSDYKQMIGRGLHVMEAYIGPVDCGSF